jgi:predicted dehydrogenase
MATRFQLFKPYALGQKIASTSRTKKQCGSEPWQHTLANSIGLGIVGSGRIGTLRARLASGHSAVTGIAVSDLDPANATKLAQLVGGRSHGSDNLAAIDDPDVTAVIVCTSEGEHMAPMLAAIERGKPVLVEKPIALTVREADQVPEALAKHGGNVRVGYSRRYKQRYQIAKEQVIKGRVGKLTGGAARVFNSRSQALAMLGRNPHATPVVDALTYYVDLMNWLFEGQHVVEIYARGQTGVLKQAGHDVPDVSYAVLTYDDGAVVNLGVSYALPEKYPALGHAARVEILGLGGVMILDDDHTRSCIARPACRMSICRITTSTWCSCRAERLATGRSANSGARLPTRRAPGSIISRWGAPARWRRRRTPAPRWKRRSRSNIRCGSARRSRCRRGRCDGSSAASEERSLALWIQVRGYGLSLSSAPPHPICFANRPLPGGEW